MARFATQVGQLVTEEKLEATAKTLGEFFEFTSSTS
jgi:hypothetical protein